MSEKAKSEESEPLRLEGRTLAHLCVDMQRMFAEDTEWRTPWMDRVLPVILELSERHAAETVFTRFVPPARAEDVEGGWRAYFERWRDFTRDRMDPGLIDLVEPLAALAPPGEILDKSGFSPFHGTDLDGLLRGRGVDTLVITGAETDVCVLAAVLSAVDLGYFVLLPKDALCSSSDETHDALLTLYANRFSQQITLCDVADVLEAWPAEATGPAAVRSAGAGRG
jgi:nicotinamidase-related amidase